MASLKGKVALITGASSGIGEGTALYFGKLGINLSLAGRNEERLAAVVNRCTALGIVAIGTAGDLSDEKHIEDLVEETVKKFGRLDILINNAGLFYPCGLLEGNLKDFDKIIAVNTRAPFYLTKLAAPHLIKAKGSVVNISSIASDAQMDIIASYSMSKAALNQMTRCAAAELAVHGVRVNAVSPGHVPTRMMSDSAETEAAFEQTKLDVAKIYPIGRIGTVEDMAKIITFLASDDSSFTTGQIVKVDGGVSLTKVTPEELKMISGTGTEDPLQKS